MPPFDGIPAALKVIRAIAEVRDLPDLGDCPTIWAEEDEKMRSYGPSSSDDEVEDEDDFDRTAEELERIQRNKVCDIPLLSTSLALSIPVAHRPSSLSSAQYKRETMLLVVSPRLSSYVFPEQVASSKVPLCPPSRELDKVLMRQ